MTIRALTQVAGHVPEQRGAILILVVSEATASQTTCGFDLLLGYDTRCGGGLWYTLPGFSRFGVPLFRK